MVELPPWRPPSYDRVAPGQPRWLEELPLAYERLGLTLRWENRHRITDLVRQRAYEALMAVDEQIEELLDLLERIGALEETIIVLTSDNGAGWGEHGLFLQIKGCPYDECIRVPLLIRYPERLAPGESDRLTLNIDMAPLLLELAGLPIPERLDGRPLSRGRGKFRIESFQSLGDSIPGWRGIRTRDHLLVRYATDEFEVHNLARDPHQLRPVAGHGAR